MAQILSGLKRVQCSLNDVIGYGSSEAEHEANLGALLRRIIDAELKWNVEKCHSFLLGLSAWYSKFVPNCTTVVEPMRALP